jgi:hypothetical protein
MTAAQRLTAVMMMVRAVMFLYANPLSFLPCNSLVRVSFRMPHRIRTTVPYPHKGISYRVATMNHKIMGAIPATMAWRVVLDRIRTTILPPMLSQSLLFSGSMSGKTLSFMPYARTMLMNGHDKIRQILRLSCYLYEE